MTTLTAADIEAEYLDALSTISPRQLWAMQLYGTACALVAVERGSIMAGTPDEQQVARDMLFEAEAARRNAMNRAAMGCVDAPAMMARQSKSQH